MLYNKLQIKHVKVNMP